MRHGFAFALATAVLLVVPIEAAARPPAQQAAQPPAQPASGLPRTPDAKPNLQGIWQVLNTAAWDIQDHSARLGVPAGQGVVEGNELPYRPEALSKKRQNFENRATADPDSKGYLLGVPASCICRFRFKFSRRPITSG